MSYPIPAPEADSYGTVDGVAAYVGVYTDDGQFTVTTTPTYERVTLWIDQVSDMFNIALADAGFIPPIQQVDAHSAIAAMVEQLVADLCHAANIKGRFYTNKFQDRGNGIMAQVWSEITDWVAMHATGFVNLKVPRVKGTIGAIGSKGSDSSGESLPPIFQRKAFGNWFPDWTTKTNKNMDSSNG